MPPPGPPPPPPPPAMPPFYIREEQQCFPVPGEPGRKRSAPPIRTHRVQPHSGKWVCVVPPYINQRPLDTLGKADGAYIS
ncbi:hypothetical protein E2C01_047608 [Portunus trituberculatus]|uniref:Uncharacterized protein n=1 Tax=Portunus trituberculatus TaxID=210409 RepID=A0A5B7G120_PORTR|nr:hypothetical protein [Portunus trituberculatus]